jgi:uncharacterized membrane protein YebE (DUF533 family)
MFDPKDLLGMMLGTGMGGHNRRLGGTGSTGGPGDLSASGMGGLGALLEGFGGGPVPGGTGAMAAGSPGPTGQAGLGRMGKFAGGAGVAILGALALNAYERYRQSQAGAAAAQQRDEPTRMPQADADAAAQVDDGEALLLIRAMVAAANADGRIDPEEEKNILGRLDRAGATAEQRDFVQREFRNPAALETLVRDVRGPEMAQRFYAASALAIKADTPAELSYLRYLADRLGLKPQQSNDLLHRLGLDSTVT